MSRSQVCQVAQPFHGEKHSTMPAPSWLPHGTEAYLEHVVHGKPIRAIAREKGCHASTILRQVRRVEAIRDDPLKDEAIEQLAARCVPFDAQSLPQETQSNQSPQSPEDTTAPKAPHRVPKECNFMHAKMAQDSSFSQDNIEREARRILRRLCESNSFLLVSPDMEKAAVFRETVPGRKTRTAVMERDVASAFAMRDWIEGKKRGRVAIYSITSSGRNALKRMLAEDQAVRRTKRGEPSPVDPFQDQHREYGERTIIDEDGARKIRYNLAESPLTALARKKNKNGSPYLTPEQLDAGERLREDFELAQIGPRTTQNWDKFLTASSHGDAAMSGGPGFGPEAARDRVANAMAALGPGLADIAFRCCCFLEGLEAAEKRLGWSARSGKIVLSIALQRLADHYGSIKDDRMVG